MGTVQNRLATLILVLILAFFLWMVHGVALPVVLGCLFAVPLYPIYTRLVRDFDGLRSLAATLAVLLAVVIFVFPIGIMLMLGLTKLQQISKGGDLIARGEAISHFLVSRLDRFIRWANLGEDAAKDLRSQVVDSLQNIGTWSVKYVASLVASTPELLLGLFLFMAAMFFMLRDGAVLKKFAARVSPFTPTDTERLFKTLHGGVRSVMLGSMLVAIVQGGLVTLALFVFGIPAAILWGLLAFFLAFIPMVGTIPVSGGAVIYLFNTGRVGAAMGMVACAAVIGVSDNIVRLLAQDGQTRMHPMLMLLGIFGGLQMFGPGGLFIGPLIAAMALWSTEVFGHRKADS
jgi:predicted PurR-regulated permease PerM